MEKHHSSHQQNMAVSNYRTSAATLPKKRQSNSSSSGGLIPPYTTHLQHLQHQQQIQQYYNSSGAGRSNFQACYSQQQNNFMSSAGGSNIINKTHRSSKDSLGSIAKEHSTTAAMIGDQSHSNVGQHHHSQHTGNTVHMVTRPPPSARNTKPSTAGQQISCKGTNTFQKTISGLTQQQKILHQNLKATVKSPRMLLSNSSKQRGCASTAMVRHEQQKLMLSPKRAGQPAQNVANAKQLLKKVTANNQQRSKSKDSATGKHLQHQNNQQNQQASNVNQSNKLTKATSQKALSKLGGGQYSTNHNISGAQKTGRTTAPVKKPTPNKQRCETTGSEIIQTMETPTSIQPPISSSTMINASRRKFISTPRNAAGQGIGSSSNGVMLAQTLLPTTSSLIQRQLSNKLLSPVTTTSRTNKQQQPVSSKTMLSPKNHIIQATVMTTKSQNDLRMKSHVKNFSLPKSGIASNDQLTLRLTGNSGGQGSNHMPHHGRVESMQQFSAAGGGNKTQFETLSMSSSNNKQQQQLGSKALGFTASNSGILLSQQQKTHQYTQSLQSNSNAPLYATSVLPSNQSLGSLFIKVPQNSSANNQVIGCGSSLTRQHKTSLSISDKHNSKVHLVDRPKTTMLAQLQHQMQQQQQLQQQPAQSQNKPFHRQHQSTALSTHNHRVLSPASSQQQLLTQSSCSDTLNKAGSNNAKTATGHHQNHHPSQNQTMVVHAVGGGSGGSNIAGSRLGIQHQRSSGDFTLQTYRHTSQSSQGFISTVSKSHQHLMINSSELQQQLSSQQLQQQQSGNKLMQREPSTSKKGTAAFTQERFSTTTLKTYKSGKKQQSTASQQQYFSGGKGGAGRPTSSLATESQTLINQQAVANIFSNSCNNRKGSQMTSQSNRRQQTALSELLDADDGVSNRSAKTHIIDEVLHQQKTEAYRDLQRSNPAPLYGMIVETSSMGQIIEQDDEMQELSIDREEIAHELLETTDGGQNPAEVVFVQPQPMQQQQISSNSANTLTKKAPTILLQAASPTSQQPPHILIQTAPVAHNGQQQEIIKITQTNNSGISGQHQNATETLRMLTNKAKTALNMHNNLNGDGSSVSGIGGPAGGTAFSIRKKSNDTVLQAASGGKDLLLPKKSQLATLLVNKAPKMIEGNSGSQLLQRNSQNAIIADGDVSDGNCQRKPSNKNKSTLMPQGLISESLVNSYLTGSGSMAGQSHKWMCSSKSAKNVMTSCSYTQNQQNLQSNNVNNANACSLGPKSELKQTEQANAENTIKILKSTKTAEKNQSVIERIEGVDADCQYNNQPVFSDDNAAIKNKHYRERLDDYANNHSQNQNSFGQKAITFSKQGQLSSQDQQGLNTPQTQPQQVQPENQESNSKRKSNSVTMPFGPKQSKQPDDTVASSKLAQTANDATNADNSLGVAVSNQPPIQESFKSTLVDYTESMNENQITRLTLEQSREMLIQACKTGDLRTVRRLAQIDKSAVNLDELVNNTSLGDTPLHYACNSGHVDIAELLIRKMNSRVDSINSNGETPLHVACNQGHKGIIERLLLARASTNIQEKLNGNTPLHVLASMNHQKINLTTPVLTGMSDTIRQTMESVNIQNTEKQSDVLDDFAAGASPTNPRLSLIELILPFAEDSKSMANHDGLLPWQCAQSDHIATILVPTGSPDVQLPVTASQIQGQGNQDGQQQQQQNNGNNNNAGITRNHSVGHHLNLNEPISMQVCNSNNNNNVVANSIEVKQVSEDEIANIFTFYKAQKTDEAQQNNPNADKQFTFQATQEVVNLETYVPASSSSAEMVMQQYQTLLSCSKDSTSDLKLQLINEEEEKQNIQNFLDEEINEINHHVAANQRLSKDKLMIKRRRTEQNLNHHPNQQQQNSNQNSGSNKKMVVTVVGGVSSQFLSQQQQQQQQLVDNGESRQQVMDTEASKNSTQHQNNNSSSRKRQEERQDTPALHHQPPQQQHGRRKSSQLNLNSNAAVIKNSASSKALFPQKQHQLGGYGGHNNTSPPKKIILNRATTATQKQSKTCGGGMSNQTIDSSKSGNNQNNSSKVQKSGGAQNATINKQLAKNRTVQNLAARPQTTNSSQQSNQNKSTARLKLAEIVQPFEMINTQMSASKQTQQQTMASPTNQKGFIALGRNSNQHAQVNNQANLSSTQKVTSTTAPNTLQKTHSSKTTTLMRAASSALDLKQKVDKQAGLLMQRSSSRQILTTGQSEKQIRIGPDQFVAHQLLGTGSFGEVFLVERKQDKKLLAMKVLSKKKIKRDNLKKYAITERNVMCSMGEHPFIVQLRYAFQTKDHLFLISDYCPGGDLSQYLEIEECFSEDKARLYIQEILLGIEALHKQNIIFRDLKPDNVIIDKKGHAMLTDFGLSRENVRRPTTGAKSFCGSYAYLAPEMLDKKGHGKAVDWYLLGVILFEMVTGLPPYYADDKDQLFKNIMRDTIDMTEIQNKQQLSDECIDLMQKLLRKDPATRIGTVKGAIEIRQHPFFRNTDWDVVLSKTIPMPEPYLANMAMDIIISQPYLVAGHPHTIGDICPRQHRSYLPGWSFTQAGHANLTESQVSDSEKLIINNNNNNGSSNQ